MTKFESSEMTSNVLNKTLKLGDLSTSRLNNFDFVRLILSFCVIITHSYIILQGNVNGDPFTWLTRGQTEIATVAVNYFFVISGFLITASWLQSRSVSNYFIKRLLRIFPAFIVAVLFCIFVVGPLATTDLKAYFSSTKTYDFFIRLVFFHKDPIMYGSLNNGGTPGLPLGSAATLRWELAAYIMVALMGLAGVLRNRYINIVLFLACVVMYNTMVWNWDVPFFGGPSTYMPRLLTYFLAGMVFYICRDVIPHSRALLFSCLFLLAASCVLGKGWHWLLPVCGTYIIFYIAYSRSIKLHHFAKYGDFSYGVFLYGYPVQQLLWYYFPNIKNPMLQAIGAMIISCGLAVLSWHFVEKPFLRLKPKPCVPVADHT